MTDQVAGITLKADATQIKSAADELQKFQQAGAKAEQQTDKLNAATAKTGNAAKQAAQAINTQAQAVNAVAKGQDGATAAITATAQAYQQQVKAGNEAIAALRLERQASRDRATTLSAERQALLAQVATAGAGTAAIKERVSAIQLEIAAERQKAAALQTSITAQRAAVQQAQTQASTLNSQGTALSRNAKLADQLGTSQKNLAFASRNAVFQLQDIAVSLDMGMPVYRVLLQQVPQVTGAFGGFGNTLKYVGALLGPIGLALSAVAAVLGTIAVVSSRSERTMSDLNKTLVLTNGYSGLTADAILRMGENADSAGRSFTKTVDTVKALAAAGVSAGADFERLSKAANDFASKAGVGVEDVVAQIAKLSSDPVGGLRALQGEYHSVTEAQIQHVQQLENQGKHAEAVAQANTLAATSFEKMATDIKNNAGYLETAMAAVSRAAKSMWDAILDVGRPSSANDQEMKVRERLQGLNTEINEIIRQRDAASGITPAQRSRLEYLNKEADALGKQLAGFTATATARRTEAQAATEAAKAQQELDRNTKEAAELLATYKTRAAQRNSELEKANRLFKAGAIDQKQYAATVAEINERLKDPAPKKAAAEKIDAGIKMLENARAELAVLRQITSIQAESAEIGQREKGIRNEIAKLQQDAIALQARADADHLTKAEKQQAAEIQATIQVKEQAAAEAKRIDALEKTAKAHQQVDAYLKSTGSQIDAIQQGYALSADAAANLAKELELVDRLQRAGASKEDIQAAQAEFNKLVEAQSGNAATLSDGFSRGLEDSLKAMGNGYTQMQDLTKFTVGQMTDTFATFFETGKFGAKDMINAILKELIRLGTSSALKSIAQMFGAGSGAGGSLFSAIFQGLTASANGNVMSGGNVSAYSGQIIDSPTLFNFGQLHKFANGAGLMGEAGPEAVMPLRRGKDGKLGVAAGGAGSGITANVSVVFQDGGGTSKQSNGDNSAATQWADGLTATIQQEIVKAKAPGGLLYQPM